VCKFLLVFHCNDACAVYETFYVVPLKSGLAVSNVNSRTSEIEHSELWSAAEPRQILGNRLRASEEQPETDSPTSSCGRNPESGAYKGVRCDI